MDSEKSPLEIEASMVEGIGEAIRFLIQKEIRNVKEFPTTLMGIKGSKIGSEHDLALPRQAIRIEQLDRDTKRGIYLLNDGNLYLIQGGLYLETIDGRAGDHITWFPNWESREVIENPRTYVDYGHIALERLQNLLENKE